MDFTVRIEGVPLVSAAASSSLQRPDRQNRCHFKPKIFFFFYFTGFSSHGIYSNMQAYVLPYFNIFTLFDVFKMVLSHFFLRWQPLLCCSVVTYCITFKRACISSDDIRVFVNGSHASVCFCIYNCKLLYCRCPPIRPFC